MSFLFSVQFPFVDLRKFLDNTGRLEFPVWPFPTPDVEFVRHFGIIRRRKCGGIEGWVGESEICEANRALKFCTGIKYTDRNNDIGILLRCVFRRLYFDGKVVGKYEVGISPKKKNFLKLDKKQFLMFIEYCLQLPVLVKNFNETSKSCSLIHAGKYLADLYVNATTSKNFLDKPQSWWVSAGVPILFLELSEKTDFRIPYLCQYISIPEEYGFKLFHYLIPYKGFTFHLWVLINSEKSKPSYYNSYYNKYNRARALRISLLRLYAEHECLRLTLRNIKNITTNLKSSESDIFQDYLNTTTRKIAKLETASNKNFDTDIIEIARESFHVIEPGQRDILLQTLQDLNIRRNVFKKLEKYTHQWVEDSKDVKIYMLGNNIFGEESFFMTENKLGYHFNDKVQAGAIGENASATDFTQIGTETKKDIDLIALASDLSKLRGELKRLAREIDHDEVKEAEYDEAIGAVTFAQKAAEKNEGSKALEYLAQAGKWTLDIAQGIGVGVAVLALKKAMGLS